MSAARNRREALAGLVSGEGVIRAAPPILMPAGPYFNLAGEEFARRLVLTGGEDGTEYCLRPDFTLPIAQAYLADAGRTPPLAYGYLGPIFRMRAGTPVEFDQAGLELIGQANAEAALDSVLGFAREALALYGVAAPAIRFGGVALFEAVLAAADLPDVWRTRIRHRFGNAPAMARLLDRLEDPETAGAAPPLTRGELAETLVDRMMAAGLSLSEGRGPDEIAARYLEKRALAAARVPAPTLALLRDYLAIAGPARHALERIDALASSRGIGLAAELERMDRHLAALDGGGALTFDAGFAPRLDYYTGIVFEMTGRDGAVLVSGGQYDRLLERLGAPSAIAASGCAIWVERLEVEAVP